jgi:hypothetical protein
MTLNYNFRELIFKYVDGTLNMDLAKLLIGRKSLTTSTVFEVESLSPSIKTIGCPFSEKHLSANDFFSETNARNAQ